MSQNSIREILAMSSKNYFQLIIFLSIFSTIHEKIQKVFEFGYVFKKQVPDLLMKIQKIYNKNCSPNLKINSHCIAFVFLKANLKPNLIIINAFQKLPNGNQQIIISDHTLS